MTSRPGNASRAALALTLVLRCAEASADESARSEEVIAEALFSEAKRLMNDRRYDEACPKLAESHRLDPSGGTVLLLALCLERQGKLASAWSAFSTAQALAARDRNADREATAREHLAALSLRLSYLTVRVAPGLARQPGLRVRLDGVALAAPAWGVALPVDPGEHEVRVERPAHPAIVRIARLSTEAQREVIELSDSLAPTASSSAWLAPTPPGVSPPVVAPTPPGVAPPVVAPTPASLTAPVLLAGAGATALVSAGVLLLSARRDVTHRDDLCPARRCPDPRARSLNDAARTKADAAAVTASVGALLVGSGLLVWGFRHARPATLQLGPREARLGWALAW